MGFKSYTSLGSQGLISASSPVKLKIQTFLSSGTLKLASKTIVNYVIIGGGGGSGDPNDYGYGGGGGGGYKFGTMTLDAGSYPIVVGDGGQAGINLNITPAQKQGKNSSFNGIIALGGGAGAGGAGATNSLGTGSAQGASSGGGGSSYVNGTGYSGTVGQGFKGGNGARGSGYRGGSGGGGGGATQAGQDGYIVNSPDAYGGFGGAGIRIDSTNLQGYFESPFFVCGGGGGSSDIGKQGIGGIGGGGNVGIAGKPNTGGGAGAWSQAGGSGIVILTFIPFYPIARYWKFSVDTLRDNVGGKTSGYMSELSLYKDNIQVSNNGIVSSKTGGGGVDGALRFLFDNNFGTKFGTSVPHEIIFAYPNAITMNQYKFATANDHPQRDPISWRLSYSLNEGVDYTLLESVVNFPTSTNRNSYIPMLSTLEASPPSYSFRVKGFSSIVPISANSGVPLTNINGVTMINDPVRGFVFKLSGNNYLSIDSNAEANNTRTFWLSSSTPNADSGNVFSSGGFPIYFNSTSNLKFFPSYDKGNAIFSNVSQNSTWIFYAVTLTPTSMSVYVNGNLIQTVSETYVGENNTIQFGAYVGGNFYTGLIDDMRLYQSTLTATQILDIYNGL